MKFYNFFCDRETIKPKGYLFNHLKFSKAKTFYYKNIDLNFDKFYKLGNPMQLSL
jgi:hypothetical protein